MTDKISDKDVVILRMEDTMLGVSIYNGKTQDLMEKLETMKADTERLIEVLATHSDQMTAVESAGHPFIEDLRIQYPDGQFENTKEFRDFNKAIELFPKKLFFNERLDHLKESYEEVDRKVDELIDEDDRLRPKQESVNSAFAIVNAKSKGK